MGDQEGGSGDGIDVGGPPPSLPGSHGDGVPSLVPEKRNSGDGRNAAATGGAANV